MMALIIPPPDQVDYNAAYQALLVANNDLAARENALVASQSALEEAQSALTSTQAAFSIAAQQVSAILKSGTPVDGS